MSPNAYVLIYRLRGTHDIMKLDRCPMLTQSSSSVAGNITPHVKRKRAESVADGGKPDRRSGSEYTLNRIKRSVSTESEENKKSGDTSPMQLRRSASTVPIDPRTKKDSIPRITSLPDVAATRKLLNDDFDKKISLVSSSASSLGDYNTRYISRKDSCDNDSTLACCGSSDDFSIDDEVGIDDEVEKTFKNVAWMKSEDFFTDEFVDNHEQPPNQETQCSSDEEYMLNILDCDIDENVLD